MVTVIMDCDKSIDANRTYRDTIVHYDRQETTQHAGI